MQNTEDDNMPVLTGDFNTRGWANINPSYLNADKTEWTRPVGTSNEYSVRFIIPKTAGHRIIASADILTDNVDVAMVYFRVFDKNGSRIDNASQGQQSKARITGQYHRVSCSIDCLHPDIERVEVAFGSTFSGANTGNVKVRNPTIQVDPVPGQKSALTTVRFFWGDSDNGGYIDYSTGYAKIWKRQDIDLSDSTTRVVGTALSGLKDGNSAGFCVDYEPGLAVDAEHISSMFLRYSYSSSERWSLYNSNPKPTSRIVPMRFWAEGFIDL